MVLVFCSDENFVQHLLVSLASLVHYQRNSHEVTTYIIDGGLTDISKSTIVRFAKENNFEIHFTKVDYSLYSQFMVSNHISLASYYRISIPDILPINISKVIYLDCDIIINASIVELWNTEFGDYAIAAAAEYDNIRNIEMGLGNTKTFNAGVMLMNLKKWRQEGISAKVLEYISLNPDKIKFHDQDALNAILLEDWKELPVKWNLTVDYISKKNEIRDSEILSHIEAPAIIHFNKTFKPWHYQLRHPYKHIYKKFLCETPFRNYIPPDRSLTNILRKTVALFLIALHLKKEHG